MKQSSARQDDGAARQVRRRGAVLGCALLALACAAQADSPPARPSANPPSASAPVADIAVPLREIQHRFTPVKPTVLMTYDVTYRFLNLQLMRVARTTIEATEGRWRGTDGREVDCCAIEMRLRSHGAEAGRAKAGRIYINDRIVSVVTMPALDTLYYIKVTDERLNPLLGRSRDLNYFHVYDLQDGGLKLLAHDYNKGLTETNLTGATDVASQGREVSRVLALLSDVYHERRGPITPQSDFRIFVNCEGRAVPFAAQSARERVRALDATYAALRMEVMPAREAPRDVRSRLFRLWGVSFAEVAEHSGDQTLQRLAAEAPAWGMTPLMADYGLALGHIRCSLTAIATRATAPRWVAADDADAPVGPLAAAPTGRARTE